MLSLSPKNKLAGVLVPLFALRGSEDLGVGDVQSLYELLDWAATIGLGVVQILPINETSNDHSPYHLLSSIAIEPSTIATTPEFLPELTPEDFAAITAKFDLSQLRIGDVCYPKVKALKLELLQAAFRHLSHPKRIQAFEQFQREHAEWLQPYALFRSLMHLNGQSAAFRHWPSETRSYAYAQNWTAASSKNALLKELQSFYAYIQWIAFSQWQDLKRYAEMRGIALMGDIPVGISPHSIDTWTYPHLFDLACSCGAPPEQDFHVDCLTKNWGQNWGFPLYNWTEMLKDGCAWWRRRLRVLRSIFHLLRLDHVLGFFRMYTFPWYPQDNERFASLNPAEVSRLLGKLPQFLDQDDSSEEKREKNRKRGETILQIFLEETGPYRLIAEDLGTIPSYVPTSLQSLSIPGMKIPVWQKNQDGELLSGASYERLSLATYGTHDHPPIQALWNQLASEAESGNPTLARPASIRMRQLLNFAGHNHLSVPQPFTRKIHLALLEGLFACNSWLAIPPITDFLGTGQTFNVPGTKAELNWKIRLEIPTHLWITKNKALTVALQELLKTTSRKIVCD